MEKIGSASADIARFKNRFQELEELAPGNQRVRLLTLTATESINHLTETYGDVFEELTAASTTANSAISGLQGFLATFNDNPGRRLISLYLGSILGLVVAGLFGLDVFQATLDNSVYPLLSIILTGILIGLGANPTHEVIRVIQEFKMSYKGGNVREADSS